MGRDRGGRGDELRDDRASLQGPVEGQQEARRGNVLVRHGGEKNNNNSNRMRLTGVCVSQGPQ